LDNALFHILKTLLTFDKMNTKRNGI
jgi:hypothetical protein